ncbi:MAG: TetR/AcrR family transcriptional regulator [Treponema sp.]
MVLKRNTRQEILNEAFLLCKDSKTSQFSLSELANRVGISKTAIFRHFKNKENLIEEMDNTFSERLTKVLTEKEYFFAREPLQTCSFEEFSELIHKVIDFFLQNPGYFEFFGNSVVLNIDKENSGLLDFQRRGVVFSESFINNKSIDRFFKFYFCLEGIEYFISRREAISHIGEEPLEDVETFKDNVAGLLWNGLGNETIQIDKKRLSELDEICKVEIQSDVKENRFFNAFAEVFSEYGMEGITVGRISKKMNIAKSSLYSFFKDKDEFIKKMFLREIHFFMHIIFEKAQAACNIDELAYIILKTEKNYLDVRPFVFMIHTWAIKNNFEFRKSCDLKDFTLPESFNVLEKRFSNLKVNMSFKTFLGWVSSGIGALQMLFDMTKIDRIVISTNYVNELFSLIECGVHK